MKITHELIKLEHEIWLATRRSEGHHLPKECSLKKSVNDLIESMPHCAMCHEGLIRFEELSHRNIEYYRKVIEIRFNAYEKAGYLLNMELSEKTKNKTEPKPDLNGFRSETEFRKVKAEAEQTAVEKAQV